MYLQIYVISSESSQHYSVPDAFINVYWFHGFIMLFFEYSCKNIYMCNINILSIYWKWKEFENEESFPGLYLTHLHLWNQLIYMCFLWARAKKKNGSAVLWQLCNFLHQYSAPLRCKSLLTILIIHIYHSLGTHSLGLSP